MQTFLLKARINYGPQHLVEGTTEKRL